MDRTYTKVQRVPDKELRPINEFGKHWLKIDSYDDLLMHEKEIVERIATIRNGGNLFMANPFLLFKDIGVQLSPRANEEIVKRVPQLSAVSSVGYEALKRS